MSVRTKGSRPELAPFPAIRPPSRHFRPFADRSGGPGRFIEGWSASGSTDRQPTTGELWSSRKALTGPILIVDDDAAIRYSLSEILEMEGYPVSTAADGTAALRQVEAVRPALLLLDMRMPGLSGWDVASALRQRNIAVPILVMTAAQDARHWAEQIGANGYLAKPFDLDDLLESVARLLRA